MKNKFTIYNLQCTILIFSTFYILHSTFYIPPALAQENFDLTYTYQISDTEAKSGDVVMSSDQGFIRANVSYSNRVFGVLQENPTIVFRSSDQAQRPVVRSGVSIVNVSTLNGPIKKGDFITSSPIAGKGQKSSQSGYTIGIALADFTGDSGDKVTYDGASYTTGQIQIAVKIEYTELTNPRSFYRFLDLFNLAVFQNLQDSSRSIEIVKYFAALIVFVASIVLGFFLFARSIPKSIEAIGRNPLARRAIQFSIILSVVLTLAASLIGVAAAFLILRI